MNCPHGRVEIADTLQAKEGRADDPLHVRLGHGVQRHQRPALSRVRRRPLRLPMRRRMLVRRLRELRGARVRRRRLLFVRAVLDRVGRLLSELLHCNHADAASVGDTLTCPRCGAMAVVHPFLRPSPLVLGPAVGRRRFFA